TEAASHTRTHPCTDADYQVLGYMSEVVGSRDDLLSHLVLPNPFIPSFVHPCSFTSDEMRAMVVVGQYLVNRSPDTNSRNFGTWSTEGFYDASTMTSTGNGWPAYTSYPNSGGNAESLSSQNSLFDTVYASGGIYQLLDHPSTTKLWSSGGYLDQHASY